MLRILPFIFVLTTLQGKLFCQFWTVFYKYIKILRIKASNLWPGSLNTAKPCWRSSFRWDAGYELKWAQKYSVFWYKRALIFVSPFTTIICGIAISGLVSEKSDRVNYPKSTAMPSHFLGQISFVLCWSASYYAPGLTFWEMELGENKISFAVKSVSNTL